MTRSTTCLLLTVIALTGVFSTIVVAKETTVKVGVVIPLSGPHAEFGSMMKESMLIGLGEINKAGLINGKTIELLFEDDTSRPEVARAAIEKLITRDRVVVTTGGYLSTTALSAAAASQEGRVPFVVQSASGSEITEQGWEYVFRLCPPVSEYSETAVSFLKDVVKPKTAATVYVNNSFGKSSAEAFSARAKASGIRVLVEQSYHLGTTDFRSLLAKVMATKPDVVFMVSYVPDGAVIMRHAKELGFNPKLFIGNGGGFTMPDFAEQAGDAAENVFSITPWTPHIPFSGAKAFCESYRKVRGTQTDYHGAEAYAALYVMADAIQRAKELTPEGLRKALNDTDMMTAFGPVKFRSYGKKQRQNRLPTYLVQWQKGKLETVWPKRVGSKPYVYPVPPWTK